MTVTDAQLHEPSIALDWPGTDRATRWQLLAEVELATMDAVGVDRAVLYPVDLDWAAWLVEQRPDRFAVVPAFAPGGKLPGFTPPGLRSGPDPLAPDIADQVAELAGRPGWVGLRLMDVRTLPESADVYGQFDNALRACADHDVPVFMSTAGALAAPVTLARRYPGLRLIVDHLGIRQPPSFPRDEPPFATLPELLTLAAIPTISLKLSGVPTLSLQPYPFTDLWPPLRELVDAFGADRLLWGSDISRIAGRIGFDVRFPAAENGYHGKHNYADAVGYLRDCEVLTLDEKRAILGGTAARIHRWPTHDPQEKPCHR